MNQNFAPPITPPLEEPKKNNTILIVVIVLVVLCCCCLGSAGLLWGFGDMIVQTLGM
jgi:hypothetical protein